jgi:hypothetical protein
VRPGGSDRLRPGPPHGSGVTRVKVLESCALFGRAQTAQALAGEENEEALNDNGGGRKSENAKSAFHSKAESTGNSASYLVRRLKWDAPRTAEALPRGE